jgi:glucose/arabinose dehydrogenase
MAKRRIFLTSNSMPSRRLLPVILALALALSACADNLPQPLPVPSTTIPLAASPSPLAVLTVPAVPSAEAGGNNPTAAPPTAPPTAANVPGLPHPGAYHWAQVITGLHHPTVITHAGDERLFIVEQPGRIRIWQNGQLLAAPFLDITSQVDSDGSEQGLLGLAFHPHYRENGFFYLNYIDLRGNTVIARFQVGSDPNLADPGSELKLLGVPQPFANHNGGQLAFGPDGYLYLGLGDGGSQGDPAGNGQSTNTLLGKLLRLDVDRGEPYAIPADNPFANGGGEPEIWAWGLRNPWRFSFDSATGDLYIGDVGQSQWEEIDYLPAGTPGGVNFGWNALEATHPYKGGNSAAFTAPVAEYGHGEGCSVTGGYVYRGAALAEWQGVYLYGDFCSGQIWGLLKSASGWQNDLLFQSGFSLSTFGVDHNGELYLADYGGGIYRLEKR